MGRDLQDPGVRVDGQPVNRNWRQAARCWNPLSVALPQHVDAEVG